MANRFISVLLALGCIFVGLSLHRSVQTNPATSYTSPMASAFDDSTLLERRIQDVRLNEVPSDAAIIQLADLARVNIVVAWAGIEDKGVNRTQPVTLLLHDVTLRQALDALCMQLDETFLHVTFYARNGIVTVTSVDHDVGRVQTEFFNVAGLLPRLTISGESGFNRPENLGPRAASMIEQLVTVITSNVATESWADNGGTVGSIRAIGGVLVVTQTRENMALVRQTLDRLNVCAAANNFPVSTSPAMAVTSPSLPIVDGAAPSKRITEYFNIQPIIRESGPREEGPNEGQRGRPWQVRACDVDNLITSLVDPVSWRDNGGTDGAIHIVGDVLVVTQTVQNMQAVRATLDQLHRALSADDFPMTPGTIATTDASENQSKPATTGKASQTVTVFLNIRPLMAAFGALRQSVEDPALPASNASDAIRLYVRYAVAPNSWVDAGGTIGRLDERGGILTVTQTPENIQAVRFALASLSEAVAHNPPPSPTTRAASSPPTSQKSNTIQPPIVDDTKH